MRKISSTLFLSSSVVAFLAMAPLSTPVFAQEVECAAPVVVDSEPPPLPDYDQPPVPGPDYVWTPGYWAWSDDEDDYYWVPGTWVLPPREGLFGRRAIGPGQAAATSSTPAIGAMKSATTAVSITAMAMAATAMTAAIGTTATSFITASSRGPRSYVSFNGGKNGTQTHPTPQQKALSKQPHFAATALQKQNLTAASKDKTFFSKDNHGKPAVAATSKARRLQRRRRHDAEDRRDHRRPTAGRRARRQ